MTLGDAGRFGSDYLCTARALGVTFSEALIRYGIHDGAVAVIFLLGIELASTLLGGIEQRDYLDCAGRAFHLNAAGHAAWLCRHQ